MSTPISTIFEGDVTLEQGSDISLYGWGDLNVNRRIVLYGTAESTGAVSQGTLLVSGGARIAKSMHVHNELNVLYGVTNLTETHIDTTNGPTTIVGGNRVDISVGDASQFVVTGGNLNVTSTTQSLQLYGGLNGNKAVDIQAINGSGSVQIMSGTASGAVNIISASGGISGFTSSGNLSLVSNNANGSFIVNTVSDNQNLTVALDGMTDSQLKLESSGTNASRTALVIHSLNTSGNISIMNANGIGSGQIAVRTGSGGFSVVTNTGGSISLTSQGAGSEYIVDSVSANQHLSIDLRGETNSSLIISSSGTNVSNQALVINTTHVNGNISISQPSLSVGKTSIFTGSGGFDTTTQTGGSIVMTTYGAISRYTNATTADNQHLYVSVSGNTNSRVIIASDGVGPNAITLQTTNGTGGIVISSVGQVQLQSNDSNAGVQIATSNPGIPVTIGTNTGVTTILGDLYVRGNTSTVDQQVVTIDDNIIVLNNAPYGTSDGGFAVKRYQPANDTSAGDVVIDTPDVSGTVQSGNNTATTVHLAASSSVVNDYYSGWWIRILSGTGAGQVRKIKSYNGTNKVAVVYDTADQSTLLGNPQPVEGMDFLTIPDNTSQYGLYPCHYVMNIWDESNNEFALVCSTSNPSDPNNPSFEPSITHYSDLHINNLQSSAIFTTMINNSAADITTIVTLNDASTTPVTIPAFPLNYGIYMLFVKPDSVTTRTSAIFMIGRVNVSSMPGTTNRLMSVKGAQNEQLFIQWRADEYPELVYRPAPNIAGSTNFRVKIVSL